MALSPRELDRLNEEIARGAEFFFGQLRRVFKGREPGALVLAAGLTLRAAFEALPANKRKIWADWIRGLSDELSSAVDQPATLMRG